jgi:hypothetical protein
LKFRLKTVAWSFAVILITGIMGYISLHYFSAIAAKSPDGQQSYEKRKLDDMQEGTAINASTQYISMSIGNPGPSIIQENAPKNKSADKERLSISIQPGEENIHVVKPVEREVTLDPKYEKELQEKKKPMQGLFETSLGTVNGDGKIDINFSLKNISGKNLQVSFGSGQKYDIWVYNEQNEEVFKWSNKYAFTQALIEQEIGKEGKLIFHEEWNLLDNKGNPVPAGKYTIEIKVMIGLISGTISQDELIAKSIIEVK